MASRALLAYLIISALVMSVMIWGASMPACMAFTLATASASWGSAPMTIRSGFRQSSTACPSRKNSGLAT